MLGWSSEACARASLSKRRNDRNRPPAAGQHLAPLGVGGMGEVYPPATWSRARSLDRILGGHMRLTRRDVWRLGVAGTISGVLPGRGRALAEPGAGAQGNPAHAGEFRTTVVMV